MKINSFYSFYFILLISTVSSLLFSCSKETESKEDFRVTSYKRYIDGGLKDSHEINYLNDKVSIINSLGGFQYGDSARSEYDYIDDNTLIASLYEKKDGIWIHTARWEFDFQDGILYRSVSYTEKDTTWEAAFIVTFMLQNGIIMEQVTEWYDSIQWKTISEAQYEYEGNKLVRKIKLSGNSGTLEVSGTEEVTYDGENVDYIISYLLENNEWIPFRKYDFSYEGQQVIAMESYEYKTPGNSWILFDSMNYSYDSSGNLESQTRSYHGAVIKTEFNYETGNGNYEQLKGVPFNVYELFIPSPD